MHDGHVERFRRRVETFEIADDEQLIGCEMDQKNRVGCINYRLIPDSSLGLLSVTWLKMKVRF